MLTIAVCDDNTDFAMMLWRRIYSLCTTLMPENIDHNMLAPFLSGKELLSHIEKAPVNILFLDVDMPDLSGFQVAEKIRQLNDKTLIIFVSAFDEFVYDSFDYSPFRFIRKNHLQTDLAPTFQKAIDRYIAKGHVIEFETVEGPMIFRIADIVYIESARNYISLHMLSGEEYKCRSTLTEAETRLRGNSFYRVHSAFLINLLQVEKTDYKSAVMRGGHTITLSRRKAEEFEQKYLEMLRRRLESI